MHTLIAAIQIPKTNPVSTLKLYIMMVTTKKIFTFFQTLLSYYLLKLVDLCSNRGMQKHYQIFFSLS